MKNTWRKSYLGFTDNKKPMQKARMENTLDNLVRYNDEVMYEKEFALMLLLEGRTPEKEENYSYYSRRLDDYTKPKTLYKLQKDDTYNEVSKTVHDFVSYLIENEFDSIEKVIDYAENERIQLEREENERLENEAKEKELQRIKAEKEKQERQKKHNQNITEWTENGKQYMQGETIEALKNSIETYWNEIEGMTQKNIQEFIDHAITTYTVVFGNKGHIQNRVNYTIQDDINNENLQNKIDKLFFRKLFNINENDKAITVTAKVNAFLENREYKGAKEIIEDDFYVYLTGEGFVRRKGEKKDINGIVFFVSKEDGKYKATESRTGTVITSEKNKSDLIKKVKNLINDKRELLDRNIENIINRIGLSPLYQNQEV